MRGGALNSVDQSVASSVECRSIAESTNEHATTVNPRGCEISGACLKGFADFSVIVSRIAVADL